jgi:Ca2+-binding EF-hand superfamily protein
MTSVAERSRKEAFEYMDEDKDGKLSLSDFKFAIRAIGVVIPESEIVQYFKMKSLGGLITFEHYSKLVDSYIAQHRMIMNEDCQLALLKELRVAFDRMDRRRKGLVLIEDVRKYLMTMGEKLTESEFNEVFMENRLVKTKGLKELNFEQFFKIAIGSSTYNLRQ